VSRKERARSPLYPAANPPLLIAEENQARQQYPQVFPELEHLPPQQACGAAYL
jgi:hypothetical protein